MYLVDTNMCAADGPGPDGWRLWYTRGGRWHLIMHNGWEIISLEVSMCVINILHTKGTFNDIITCIITCYRILWKVLNHTVMQFC